MDYKCLLKNKCNIASKKRIECKACRFRHCLEVGMSKHRVKLGRKPKITFDDKKIISDDVLEINKTNETNSVPTNDNWLSTEIKTQISYTSNISDHSAMLNYYQNDNVDSELIYFQAKMLALNFKFHELENESIKNRAKTLSNNDYYNQTTFSQCILNGIKIGLSIAVNSVMNFAKEIPGLTKIQDTCDFKNMINNSVFEYLIVCSFIIFFFNHSLNLF
jgi:hypothetical protein